jgi:hypothetical protein
MFGFEIVIDSVSSPLLNGSITSLETTVISEVASKIPVYEDFSNSLLNFSRLIQQLLLILMLQQLVSHQQITHSDSPKNLHQSGKHLI